MDTYQKFKNDQTGTVAVEFAILAPIFLIILAGIVNIGLVPCVTGFDSVEIF